jgi:hypothetical protein
MLQAPFLVGAGACLALMCSQTFLWELSQHSWRFGAWVGSDPDRLLIYAASFFGTIVATIAVLVDNGRWSLTYVGILVLSSVPVVCSLCVGMWFYR